MQVALKKEASLTHGESIDNFMDMEQCELAMKKIDRQKSREISKLDKNDPNYAEMIIEIEKRAKLTKYRMMKKLNH